MKSRQFAGHRRFALLVAVTGALAGTAAISAQPTPFAPEWTAPANPEFKKLDANHDGYVSRVEAKRIPDFGRAFDEADENRDGKLDADEFAKAQAIHERLRAARFVEDGVITAKVKAALLKDPLVSGVAVSVTTYKGAVLLSGFVSSEQQARRAAQVAAGTGGVTSVKNSLIVKNSVIVKS
jgi:hyperosmotically inducible protein